jgi:hypothetical protein
MYSNRTQRPLPGQQLLFPDLAPPQSPPHLRWRCWIGCAIDRDRFEEIEIKIGFSGIVLEEGVL